jgi:hypothetical protein
MILGSTLVVSAAGPGPAPAPAAPATDVCGPLNGDTTWNASGSPYVTSCDVEVPDGVTLTIESGVEVQLNYFHRLVVSGSLQVRGTEDSLVEFKAADPENAWDSVVLEEGSGPTEIAYARFTGGGAGRHEMLGISSDDALVRDSIFTEGVGIAIEVKDGASPVIADCHVKGFQDRNPNPPAAVRVRGASDVEIRDCLFESNIYPIYIDSDVSPTFYGNRFIYNGHNGVLWYGRTSRDVVIPSLGPRSWSYEVLQSGVFVETGASVTIQPGATLEFAGGTGIRVGGTLAIRGEATNKVLLTSNSDSPNDGAWKEIEFQPDSADYVPETGRGSIVDHAIIEYSGANQTGSILIRNTSPRISNTTITHSGRRGITITGEDSRPILQGNLFDSILHDPDGIAIFAEGSAAPSVSFSRFYNNLVGVRSERGAAPMLESHNRFYRNISYSVSNADREVCIEATGNDWGGKLGPRDGANLPTDACGVGKNDGDGDRVSNHVRYAPFEGQIERPVLQRPQCGTIRATSPTIEGIAPPGSTVEFYDNFEPIGQTTTGAGPGDMASFSFTTPTLAEGSHVLQARAVIGDQASGMSEPLELLVDPDRLVDAGGMYIAYDLDGTHYVQPFQNPSACLTLRSGDWMIRPHPPAGPVALHVPISCPTGATPTASMRYNEQLTPLQPVGGADFEGEFNPGTGGALSLLVTCDGDETELLLGTVEILYDGFVFDEAKGQFEGRLPKAKVTLEKWNASLGQYEVWPASEYFGQTNPQTTGVGGWYAFYPQRGFYRAKIVHSAFDTVVTDGVDIEAEPFALNVPLTRKPGVYLPITLHTHDLRK